MLIILKFIMSFQTFSIILPTDILSTINESELELQKRLKVLLAVQLYLEGKISIGKASQISGFSRLDFETYLSENRIPISLLDFEEVMGDVEKVK